MATFVSILALLIMNKMMMVMIFLLILIFNDLAENNGFSHLIFLSRLLFFVGDADRFGSARVIAIMNHEHLLTFYKHMCGWT